MPRSLTNSSSLGTQILPEHSHPEHAHPHEHDTEDGTRLAAGGYLEIHSGVASWRLKVTSDGKLSVQKEQGHGVWQTRVVVH